MSHLVIYSAHRVIHILQPRPRHIFLFQSNFSLSDSTKEITQITMTKIGLSKDYWWSSVSLGPEPFYLRGRTKSAAKISVVFERKKYRNCQAEPARSSPPENDYTAAHSKTYWHVNYILEPQPISDIKRGNSH